MKTLSPGLGGVFFADFGLFVFRYVNNGLTFGATRAFVDRFTGRTLNKQEIAGFVGTIYMYIRRLPTLVAVGNHIVRNMFSQALVKDKVFALKPIGELGLLDLACIVDDASVQLVDILKAMMLEVGRGLFAANSPRAIEEYRLVFVSLEHLENLGQFFSERLGLRQKGAFKMPNFRFVVLRMYTTRASPDSIRAFHSAAFKWRPTLVT